MSVPPLYNSFDDSDANLKCLFCKKSESDDVSFGNKYTYNGITFHNFCLVSILYALFNNFFLAL